MRLWRLLPCVLALASLAAPAQAGPAEDRQAALQLLGRGAAAFDVGDVLAATRHWTDAIHLCRLAGAPRLEAEALARRGEAYRGEGQFREAAEDLTAALARAKAAGDEALVAAASGALGNLAFMARRTAAAEPLLLDSQARAQRLGDAAVMSASANALGNLYAATGRPRQAAQAYGEAARSAEAAGDPALAATAETNAARLALEARDGGRAASLLNRATGRLVRLEPSYPAALALYAAGTAALAGEQSVPAPLASVSRQALEAASAVADRLGNAALQSLVLGGLGHLHERTGGLEQASRLTEQALFRAQGASAPDILFRWNGSRPGSTAPAGARTRRSRASGAPCPPCNRSAGTSPSTTGTGNPPSRAPSARFTASLPTCCCGAPAATRAMRRR